MANAKGKEKSDMAKARLADQMEATEAAYGWTREQLLSNYSRSCKVWNYCQGGFQVFFVKVRLTICAKCRKRADTVALWHRALCEQGLSGCAL